jgi:branched-chain amino acid transport system permease protein
MVAEPLSANRQEQSAPTAPQPHRVWRSLALRVLVAAETPLFLVCILLGIAGLAGAGDPTLQRDSLIALINVTAVLGIYVFSGTSGVLSFGHLAFMALGAYLTAILRIPTIAKATLLPGLPHAISSRQFGEFVSLAIVLVVCAAVAGIIAWPISRLVGIAASLASFALLLVIHNVLSSWDSVTRGSSVMLGVPTITSRWTALSLAVAVLVAAFAFRQSRAGLLLVACREDELAARAVGISPENQRRIAFVLSALPVAAAGWLYAQYLGSFSPDSFFLNATFLYISMLVVGGMRTISGAVVGVAVISVLQDVMRRSESGFSFGFLHVGAHPGISDTAVGILVLLAIILRPNGLAGSKELTPVTSACRALKAIRQKHYEHSA